MESTYLLVGQSSFLINEHIKTYVENFKLDPFNIVKLDASETEIEDILQELRTVSFFSDLKMIVVEHVESLTRYDERILEDLYRYFKNPSDDIILILTASDIPKGHSLGTYLENHAYIENIQDLDEKSLIAYVQKLFEQDAYQIEEKTIRLIIERSSNDLYLIHQEIKKIKMYALDEKIVYYDDVDLLVTRNLEDNIFSFSTAFLDGNLRLAMQIYDDLLTNRMPPLTVLNHLFNSLQIVLKTKLLMNQGLNQATIASTLGVSSGRTYHLMRTAKQHSLTQIETLIKNLAALDVDIKSGVQDDRLGIELLLLRRLA